MLLDENLKLGVLDIETSGLDPVKDRIVEVAFVPVRIGRGIVDGQWSKLFNPGIPIPPSASAIHHIIDEDVAECEPFDIDLVKPFGPNLDYVFAAHNASFDNSFLKLETPFICTMRLAQKLWPELDGYSNQTLRYYFKLKPPIEHGSAMHRALPDALVTATLLIHELEEIVERSTKNNWNVPTLEYLIQWIAEPMLLTTVRFGKHKGLKWSEVPRDYLRWLVNNLQDADVDTIHTAKFYLN